jgi:hypothetical protein
MGRAPGCGRGGPEESAVVVAGTEAGTVRVGGGAESGLSEAVLGVMPSGFMGAFLWIGMGGIVQVCIWCLLTELYSRMLELLVRVSNVLSLV